MKRRREERGFPEIKVSRRLKKATVEATETLIIQLTPPVRACCHVGKSRAFDSKKSSSLLILCLGKKEVK